MKTKLRFLPFLALVALFTLLAAAVQAQPGGFSGRGGSYGGYSGRSSRGGSSFGRSSSYGGGYGSNAFGQDGGRQMGTALIEYDVNTGSIIIISDDETNERIKQVIEGLDRPIPQVLIKVLFLEVTHGDGLDIGIEFKGKDNDGTDVSEISTLFGIATELATGSPGAYYKIIEEDLEGTLRALGETNKLEVLSRPSILTRNNQEAMITVGQEIPFITRSQLTDTGQINNTIQYSDIGIILQVLPHIAPGRMVELQVAPEISSLTADSVQLSNNVRSPVIAKRSAETRVLVGDGKTVVIGGMMEDLKTEMVQKIPLLGDIPYLGALFRRTITENTKTELLIFLTPIVVEAPEELQAMSDAERANTVLAPEAYDQKAMDHYLNKIDTLPEGMTRPPMIEPGSELGAKPKPSAQLQQPSGNTPQVQAKAEAASVAEQSAADQPPPAVMPSAPQVLYEDAPLVRGSDRQPMRRGGRR